jgi:hypothetical protein
MASSISPVSLLNSAYQSAGMASPSTTTASSSDSSSAEGGVSSTAQLTALESQGELKAYLNNSVALAVLQPSGQASGAAPNSTTLINNLLQQVLGAYQAQSSSS